MRDGRYLSRNDVEFRLYRKFSAEASISFDEIDGLAPLPDDEPDSDEPGAKPPRKRRAGKVNLELPETASQPGATARPGKNGKAFREPQSGARFQAAAPEPTRGDTVRCERIAWAASIEQFA